MPHENRHGHAILKLHRNTVFGEVSIGGPDSEMQAKPALSSGGTLLAINSLALGVPAKTANPSHRGRRGGARNWADRTSDGLSAAQVSNLLAAAEYAAKIGLPFNRMTTVHWQALDVPLAAVARATGRYLDLFTKAVQRHGKRTTWIFVHESGAGKGAHMHALVHVPPELGDLISRRQRAWIKAITGKPYKARVIYGRAIVGAANAGAGGLYKANIMAALGYILKSANPEAAAHHGLTRLEPGGRIIGKRAGTSQNIAPKARGRK
jgi:hypothetical protein